MSSELRIQSSEFSPLPHKQIGVAVILNDRGQILIDRRRAGGSMGGLWEFPGGKIEPNETVTECIKREIREELGIEIEVGDFLISIEHIYANKFSLSLIAHYCKHIAGEPQTIECEEIRWVTLAEIDGFAFPEANSQIIAALRKDRHCFL